MTTNNYVRVQEAADRWKPWDAETAVVEGILVYRQRVTSAPESIRLEDDGAGTLLIGKAPPGAAESSPVWQIKKILTSGGNMSILFPEGSADYGYSWASRAGYVYS